MKLSKKTLLSCLALFLVLGVGVILFRAGMTGEARPSLQAVDRWSILLDYDPETFPVNPKDLRRFQMVILDPDSHPPLEELKGKVFLIAYLSVGEAESYRSYWSRIREQPWIVGENPNWPENYFVDVRNGEWKKRLVEEMIPPIVEQGFQGLMLDTLDTAAHLEGLSGERYAGMPEAMVRLVKTIRDAYPGLFLISNNGLEILPQIASYVDGVLAEDVFSRVDFQGDAYQKTPAESRKYKTEILKEIQQAHGLPIWTLDYAPESQRDAIRDIQNQSRGLGFRPYVAEKELSRMYEQ